MRRCVQHYRYERLKHHNGLAQLLRARLGVAPSAETPLYVNDLLGERMAAAAVATSDDEMTPAARAAATFVRLGNFLELQCNHAGAAGSRRAKSALTALLAAAQLLKMSLVDGAELCAIVHL